MPIYEYEATDHDCLMCPGRFEVIQSVAEEALQYCPSCGLPCKRVVSRATFRNSQSVDHDRAAQRGFTTWKRAQKGVWEKVSGPGVDVIQGTPEDIAAVEAEKNPPKVLDLDKGGEG